MSVASVVTTNPYVGPRPFEIGEALFGREREARELVDLLIAERIVLLYSPSGAGKTSLIQALLIDALVREGFDVLPVVRVTNPARPPNPDRPATWRYVDGVQSWLDGPVTPPAPATNGRTDIDLADYLGNPTTPQIVIFDQFEEILTVDPTDSPAKEEFFRQVGVALRNRQRWALFSMREDYVPALDPYLHRVPTGLTSRFRLDLLGQSAARMAIQLPCEKAGVKFEDAAATRLVDDLRIVRVQQSDGSAEPRPGPNIEPVQLQVVCQRLWQARDKTRTVIRESDVAAVGDVNSALAGYYAEKVGAIAVSSGVSERSIRDWVENSLITPQGLRGQVLQAPAKSQGMDNGVIDALVDAYILRAERRRAATWYELTHDRFVEPIKVSNLEWSRDHLNAVQVQGELWNRQARPDNLLILGGALRDANRWAAAPGVELTLVEDAYLTASRAVEKSASSRRSNFQLRMLALIASLTVILLAFYITQITRLTMDAQDARLTAEHAEATAVAERDISRVQADLAFAAGGRADEQRRIAVDALATATTAREAMERAASVAVAQRRAAAATAAAVNVIDLNPERSALLALQAVQATIAVGENVTLEAQDILSRATQNSRIESTITAHKAGVNAVAFSPDGMRIVTGSTDGTIVVSDAARPATTVHTLTAHSGPVRSVAFAPAGERLVSGADDNTTIIWDTTSWTVVHTLADSAPVRAVAVSPDGTQVAVALDDARIQVWDVASGRPARALAMFGTKAMSVAFNADPLLIAGGGADGVVRVWEPLSGAQVAMLPTPQGGAASVAFNPRKKLLAAAGGIVRIWDTDTWDVARDLPRYNVGGTNSVVFSPDGHWLATGDTDLRVRLWNPDTAQQVLGLIAHDEVVRGIAFRPDGDRLATTGDDKTAKIWRVSQTEFHDKSLKDVAFSPDGRAIATASEDGTVRVWDATTLAPLFPPLEHPDAIVFRAAFNPVHGQAAYLATAGAADRTVKVWTARGTLLWQRLASDSDEGELNDVAFSSDGTRIATASRDRSARIWDSTTGVTLGVSPRAGTWVGAVAFSPVERLLAIGDADGKVMLWRFDTGQVQSRLEHSHWVDRLAFSPDGRLLATATTDGVVTVWDVTSGTRTSGTHLYRWHAHAGRATTVAFTQDGALLATAGDDHVAKIWDLTTGEVRQTLTHDVGVNAVAFSPDQKRLATASVDHHVHVYPLELPELIALAGQRVSRSLSNEECESYLHEQTCR